MSFKLRKPSLSSGAIAGAVGVAFVVGSAGGAYAGHQIHTKEIAKHAVTWNKLAKGVQKKIHKAGKPGPQGVAGPKGDSGILGAYYSVASYDKGDTNAGAIATVACKNETDVAISGGVQVTGIDAGANQRNTPVSSSFPGRMDWSTNAPRPDRLDGWIVQFGGNAGATSDKAPEKTKIWALCVPGANIPVEQTYVESSDD